jgi:hypothetical protein
MTKITDKDRMDFLVKHCVEVRIPLQYGSKELFHAQEISEDWEDYKNDLREQIDRHLQK